MNYLREWWQGRSEQDAIGEVTVTLCRTSRLAHVVVDFISNDWRWLTTTGITLIAAVAAVIAAFYR